VSHEEHNTAYYMCVFKESGVESDHFGSALSNLRSPVNPNSACERGWEVQMQWNVRISKMYNDLPDQGSRKRNGCLMYVKPVSSPQGRALFLIQSSELASPWLGVDLRVDMEHASVAQHGHRLIAE
jgi:hypothetical protein